MSEIETAFFRCATYARVIAMAKIDIAPVHPEFGAKVTGIDLRRDLDEAAVATIREAVDTFSFLVFPKQSFDDEAQLALTRRFGEPEPSHVAKGEGRLEYFGTIGNVQPDGSVLGNSHKKTVFLTGNNMWHSDASFKETPAFVSIMCAYETPAGGGATLFASTRTAHARLPMEMRAEPRRSLPMRSRRHSPRLFRRCDTGSCAASPASRACLSARVPGRSRVGRTRQAASCSMSSSKRRWPRRMSMRIIESRAKSCSGTTDTCCIGAPATTPTFLCGLCSNRHGGLPLENTRPLAFKGD